MTRKWKRWAIALAAVGLLMGVFGVFLLGYLAELEHYHRLSTELEHRLEALIQQGIAITQWQGIPPARQAMLEDHLVRYLKRSEAMQRYIHNDSWGLSAHEVDTDTYEIYYWVKEQRNFYLQRRMFKFRMIPQSLPPGDDRDDPTEPVREWQVELVEKGRQIQF